MKNILVAKSYQDLPKVGEVFTSSDRQYINVQLKSGKLKTVRAYSEAEYNKMYPAEGKPSGIRHFKTQKEVLGFTEGYITIFKGKTFPHKEMFRAAGARYGRSWGWYFFSTETVPAELPEGIEAVKLDWDLVGNEDGYLKSETEVKAAVEALLYEESTSEYVGSIGERLDLTLTVEKAISLDGYYGHSTMHLMRDEVGNLFVWTTASKTWAADSVHHIRGTVKEHKVYRNEKQTALTRCTEVK